MKPVKDKTEFVRLRAEGRSYAHICKQLKIGKGTCTLWEKELKAEIAELKGDQLRELYHSYHMAREARIKRLGDTLNQITEALEAANLGEIAPERLLDFKLKYTEALKGEYIDIDHSDQIAGNFNPQDILNALGDLLNRIRAGALSPDQAGKESLIISNMLKVYETVELQGKIDAIEAVVARRT